MCTDLLGAFITGSVGGFFAGIGIWLLDRIRELWLFNRDEKRIIKFFNNHVNETDDGFRTTYRIASEVNLPMDRVVYVASYSKNIKRNQKESELWAKK